MRSVSCPFPAGPQEIGLKEGFKNFLNRREMSASDVKLEPDDDSSHGKSRRSDSSGSSSRSSSSDSSNSGEWTDEETKVKRNAVAPPASTTKRKRTPAPRRFTKDSDYNRFDRPDMFVNSMFNYMGIHLTPDPSRKPTSLQAFKILNKNSKILRLSVEGKSYYYCYLSIHNVYSVKGGVVATGAELFGSLQKSILENPDQSILPSTTNLKGQSLSLDYSPPHGDELHFGSHAQDSSWIGKFIFS